MFEIIFLVLLALVALLFASIHDLREKLVSNWLVLGLLVFALAFRFFFSLFKQNFTFFFQGAIGFALFFVVAILFYYARLFGGGDVKLMMALGAILPFFSTFSENLKVLLFFVFALLLVGFVYSLLIVIINTFFHWKPFMKRFSFHFRKYRFLVFSLAGLGVLVVILSFFIAFPGFTFNPLSLFGILFIFFPFFAVYVTAVEHASFVYEMPPKKLVEGDSLYKDVVVQGKKIKASSLGLNTSEIHLLRKHKKSVLVVTGVPFVPVFLITFVLWVVGLFLWNPFW